MAQSTQNSAGTLVCWDDPTILRKAGNSPEGVRNLLARYGQEQPTALAVYQWVSRRSIPNKWRAALVYALLAEQRASTMDLFRVGDPRRRVPAWAEAEQAAA